MASQQVSQKLNFKVIYCTGEDPLNPVQELDLSNPHSKGWCSTKFCEYPQEIILQFTPINPAQQPFVNLQEIQIIAHQSKIPTSIDLFSFMPGNYQSLQPQLPLHNLIFEPLGTLQFDSVANPPVRELRTAYLPPTGRSSAVMLLKLSLRGFYESVQNSFNQVSLLALNCLGSPYSLGGSLSQPIVRALRFEDELLYDEATVTKLGELEEAKQVAVQARDYEKAKKIKEAIEKLRVIGQKINELVKKKRQAMEKYEFAKAGKIKEEIESIRRSIMNSRIQFNQKDDNQKQQLLDKARTQRSNIKAIAMVPLTNEIIMKQKKDYLQPQNDKDRLISQELMIQTFGQATPLKLIPLSNQKPPIINQTSQINNSLQGQSFQALDDYLLKNSLNNPPIQKSAQKPFAPQGPKNIDDMVIPTLQNNKQNIFDEYGEEGANENGIQNGKIPDTLNEQQMKIAAPLIPILNEQPIKMLFSTDWHVRESSLTKIDDELHNSTHRPEELFTACFGVIAKLSSDKIAQVALAAMNFTIKVVKDIYPALVLRNNYELNQYSSSVISNMMDKIGDNNARLREITEQAALAIASHPTFNSDIIIKTLVITPQASKKAAANSIKHIFGKLSLLKKIVQQSKNAAFAWRDCIKYAISNLQHSAAEIRTASSSLILELYQKQGKSILPELDSVKPSYLEQLQKAFVSIDQGNPAQAYQSLGLPYNPSHQLPPSTQNHQANKSTVLPSCEFCGLQSHEFQNEEALDLHLFKDCQYLAQCDKCEQVIEIPKMREHWLEECEHKGIMRQCPRCKQVVQEDEFETHVKESKCKENPNDEQMCPLCREGIVGKGEHGWRKHLIEHGCQKNPRKKNK